MNVLTEVRAAGIRAEIFPRCKQDEETDGVCELQSHPFVATLGENEMNEGKVTLKNMETGGRKWSLPQSWLAN